MKKIILLLLLPAQLVFAQNEVMLDSCYSWTRQNYPNLKQAGVWEQITALKKENLKTANLPQLTLNGQASYQSDVTKIDVPNLPVNISPMSKDQYKAYAEFRQSIWDGGITTANTELEDAILKSNLSQLEVELYKLNEQVSQSFFTALAIDQQNHILEAQIEVLQEKLKEVRSGIKAQVVEASAEWEIEAEMLNMEQNRIQLLAGKSAAVHILSILTGKNINDDAEFQFQQEKENKNTAITRPENELFANQRSRLDKQSELLSKTRNPKVFGFGQAGYGRPGLNMLNNNFDTYYMVGVGVSWNAFDWKKTAREKQMLQLQTETINQQEETFTQNINVLLAQQQEQIYKLEKLLKTDKKMVTLRSNIVKTSASKLENETIKTSDYIQDVQAETIAKLNAELHQIQLNEAREKYSLIQGKNEK